ncbi:MAG TPA: DNA-processing protein DprA [Ferruginibacter sp.]|nr:DNA-processing protein DprA [Ferruginibacter sp.]
MNNDLLFQVALTMIPQIGDVHAKALIARYGDAESVFKAPRRQLEHMEGIGTVRANSIKSFTDFTLCEAELSFIEKYKITPLFITETNYPKRLLHCYDSPPLLYYRGEADLNSAKIITIVGTRNNSEYGKIACEKLVDALRGSDILIVSGLAFGIDSLAHKAALKNNLPTVGVLAHGLDRLYPPQNKSLAKAMMQAGGLITDFRSGTNPDRQNFPRRNRIAAGLCDALVVIESGKKGGSLITAELANSYNREVFAIPGRMTDSKSEGCHYLIKNNKAMLITCADDLLETMNWKEEKKNAPGKQCELFPDLTEPEKIIFDLILGKSNIHIDELYNRSGMGSGMVAAALLSLEMGGIIVTMPGKSYKIN